MKIQQIQFNNFRTYRQETFNIPEDKKIVLIYGRNGFGKSSLFDGIEWGLTGKLARYDEGSREKNEYPMLRNSLADISNNDGVKITFTTGDAIKRFIPQNATNDYGEGTLFLNSNPMEDENGKTISLKDFLTYENYQNDINFEQSFNFTQLLSQELISDFIRKTKDPDRYRIIENLFGLQSFHKYDAHFTSAIKTLNNKLNQINSQIEQISKNIEIETHKLSVLTIEPHLKLKELESIYGQPIKMEELNQIQKKYITEKIELESQNIQYKMNLTKLEYLHSNFTKMEQKIAVYGQQHSNYLQLLAFVELFKKKIYFEIISGNIANYLYFLQYEQQINTVAQELSTLNEAYRHPFFKDFGSKIEEQIKALSDFDQEYKPIVDKYFEHIGSESKLRATIESLEMEMKQLSDLRNNLFHAAVRFLDDAGNQNLEKCPVCDNDFNQLDTIEQLKEQLSQSNNFEFKAIRDVIAEKEDALTSLEALIENEKNELLEVISQIKENYARRYQELTVTANTNKQYFESYQAVVNNLSHLKISFEEFDVIKTDYFERLQSISEYKAEASMDYYTQLVDEQHASLVSKHTEFEQYLAFKQEFNTQTLEDIEKIIVDIAEHQKVINSKIISCESASVISQELVVHFLNNEAKAKIESFSNEKAVLSQQQAQIARLLEDYSNLQRAVKLSSDDEISQLLTQYADTIKKFYHYLNPSMYMRDLNLRIQPNESRSNRLIFEVSSSENEKKHSPSYIFSAAQNNVLALSIFLSFAIKQQWSKLDAIFLDDPIQNMDDINIHSFVDLIRGIQKQTDKQFFISTHDDRIYNFMLHKFGGNDKVHTFEFEDYGVIKGRLRMNSLYENILT
jgi:DNA repair exonuclease SbcCD ATPase subunit